MQRGVLTNAGLTQLRAGCEVVELALLLVVVSSARLLRCSCPWPGNGQQPGHYRVPGQQSHGPAPKERFWQTMSYATRQSIARTLQCRFGRPAKGSYHDER